MSEIEIKLPNLSRVALEPGDTLLVRSPHMIDSATADAWKAKLGEYFPGHQVVVLGGGLELSVVRPVKGSVSRIEET